MVFTKKKRQIIGGAYNEIKKDEIKQQQIKQNNQTIINDKKTKNATEDKLKTFINFKFK
jgi:hypothetical protein